ncbi:Scr1 family TA system antitoxin-like transcriptional regulator [Streptomyces sp. NBC_00343]|uniref:Scr1 family TA system antitoxin-like transcriptional regulator n=1 Tax=Streptomyces sp. NBC_00343 TaxID=2975719 RepID=UPI002E2AC9CB|nr:Scr1 family TA system antitoxin-like transcriptional regulator [Streptomyces sp. NBC_00343]
MRQPVGGREVMRVQLARLAVVARLPDIRLQACGWRARPTPHATSPPPSPSGTPRNPAARCSRSLPRSGLRSRCRWGSPPRKCDTFSPSVTISRLTLPSTEARPCAAGLRRRARRWHAAGPRC